MSDLAPLFAQVRENLERLRYAISTPNEFRAKADDALAALSVIERHVHDMEKALGGKRKQELIDGMAQMADDLEAGVIFWQDFPPDLVRRFREALLPARETGTE